MDILVTVDSSEKRQWVPKLRKKGKGVDPTRDHVEDLVSLEEYLGLVEHGMHKTKEQIKVLEHHHVGLEEFAPTFEDSVKAAMDML